MGVAIVVVVAVFLVVAGVVLVAALVVEVSVVPVFVVEVVAVFPVVATVFLVIQLESFEGTACVNRNSTNHFTTHKSYTQETYHNQIVQIVLILKQ